MSCESCIHSVWYSDGYLPTSEDQGEPPEAECKYESHEDEVIRLLIEPQVETLGEQCPILKKRG